MAIDDFGTGYSSLSQVLSLPCDIMKIDRSFVASMLDETKTLSLVRAMIQIGHDIGLDTIGEGVETIRQAEALRAMGCDAAQGFLSAHPLALDDLLQWLADRPAAPAMRR